MLFIIKIAYCERKYQFTVRMSCFYSILHCFKSTSSEVERSVKQVPAWWCQIVRWALAIC